jgi:uncharacterized membrane protein
MERLDFLLQLRERLSCLPQDDMEERLTFYNEMIDDLMEEGLSEEEAVAQIGNVDEIVSQILQDTPLSTLVKERIKPKKRLKPWQILLLAVGSPLWFSLLMAALAVAISLYAVLWVLVICLWAVFAAVAACALGGMAGGGIFAASGNRLAGIATIGAALVCAGVSIFLFCGCKAATKGAARLTGKIISATKRCFMKKEVPSC